MFKHKLQIIKECFYYTFHKHKVMKLIKNNPFKIISLNLRKDTWKDGDNCWSNRKESIVDFIKREQPHVMCMQEVMPHMYKYLLHELGEVYTGYGVSCFTGINLKYSLNTLGNAIIYDKHKYELVSSGKFYLSPTPNRVSCGWGSSEPRTCIYVELYDKKSDRKFYVYNTHLDHVSNEARQESVKLIASNIKNVDTYLMGDFNTPMDSEDLNILYEILDCTYNHNKDNTFNCFHKTRTKALDGIFFEFGKNFKIKIAEEKLSDHAAIIIYESTK